MVDEHLDMDWTLKTACGAADIFRTSSVVIKPGCNSVLYTFDGKAVVTKLVEPFLSGTGTVNRYGRGSSFCCSALMRDSRFLGLDSLTGIRTGPPMGFPVISSKN